MSRLKKIIRVLVVLFIVLAIGAAVAPSLLGGFVRDRVERELNAQMNGDVSIASVSLGWTSGLDVQGFVMKHRDAKQPSVEVASLSLRPELSPLLSGRVRVPSIDLRGVTVRVSRRNGVVDLADIMKPSEAPKGESTGEVPDVAAKVTVTDLTVVYDDDQLGGPVTLAGLGVSVELETGKPVTFSLRDPSGLSVSGQLEVFDGKRMRDVESYRGQIDVAAKALDLGAWATVASPWLRALAGRIDVSQKITLEGTAIKATGSASGRDVAVRTTEGLAVSLPRFAADTDVATGGELEFAITLRDTSAEIGGLARLTKPLRFERIAGEVRTRAGRVDISGLEVRSDVANLDVSGSLGLTDDVAADGITVRLAGTMERLAGIVAGLPALAGRLESNATLKRDAGTWVVRGKTSVADFEARDLGANVPPISDKEVVLRHDLDVGAERIAFRACSLTSSFARAEVTGAMAPRAEGGPDGSIQVTADADLAKVSAILGDLLPGRLAGRLELAAAIIGRDGLFDLDTTVKSPNLEAWLRALDDERLDLGQFQTSVVGRFSPETKTLADAKISLESRIARGTIRGTLPLGAEHPRYDLDVDLTADTRAVASLLGDRIPARIEGEVAVKGGLVYGDGFRTNLDLTTKRFTAAPREHAGALPGAIDATGRIVAARDAAGTMTIDNVSMRGNGFDVTARSKDANRADERTVALESSVDLGQLRSWIETWSDLPVALRGKISAKGDVGLALEGGGFRTDLAVQTQGFSAAPRDPGGAFPTNLDLQGRVRVRRDAAGTMVVEEAGLAGSGARLSAKTAASAGVGEQAFTLSADVDTDALRSWVTTWSTYEVGGRIEVNGDVGMTETTKRFDLRGGLKSFRLGGPAAGGGSLAVPQATFAARGSMAASPQLDDLRLHADSFDLKQASGATITGGALDVTGRLDAAGKLELDVVGQRIAGRPEAAARPTPPSELRLKVGARREADGESWTLDNFDLGAIGVTAKGSGRYGADRSTVRANVDLDLTPFAATWLPIWLEGAAGRGKGRLTVDMDLPQEGGRLSRQARGSIVGSLDSLSWSGLSMTNLQLDGRLADGVFKINRGDVNVNGGACRLGGQVSTIPAVPASSFELSAKKVQIVKEMQPWVARVVPIFAGLGAVVVAELDLDMQGSGQGESFEGFTKTLNGTGALACRDGKVSSSPLLSAIMGALSMPPELNFTSIATNFRMQDGGVAQDGLRLDGDILEMRIAGVTRFDGTLDHTVGVKPKPTWKGSDKFAQFAQVLDPEGFVPFGIGGTVSSPTPKLPDPTKIIGNAVEGLLKKGLGELFKKKDK